MTTITTNAIVIYHQNVNFEKMDTERLTGKEMMDFDYCKEYLRSTSNIIMAVLRKTFSFSCDLQIDKKNQRKRRSKERN